MAQLMNNYHAETNTTSVHRPAQAEVAGQEEASGWMRRSVLTRPVRWYYAVRYDSKIKAAERAGLAQMRHDKLCEAVGATIEIGAGTGLNLGHYPSELTELVLVEPDPSMRRRLQRRKEEVQSNAAIVGANAERLPFANESFDTAVVSFVLCSVTDVKAALGEITRILVPGGQVLFLEHVRSIQPWTAARQDKVPFPYSLIGCRPNRDTLQMLESSRLKIESLQYCEVPMAPEIERPMIIGTARRPRVLLARDDTARESRSRSTIAMMPAGTLGSDR